ncbi:MAG TPA: tRNA (adenosine(37)-N6)-threonylcarbamoyltransferase complex ATPase subunit type 1 TsaE [Candidatus Colwellbacteria bacterium]|jgi:tRNA threonylcarbamoyladenosine biosynthesis protein TsaE|nr:tRNA (adenosine(37)-N6)-threonylcarbamoyltransferase complex ATPase subunit type 1 TsaE [Candidatus Colwellbacteria bacterium]HQA95827.1 tRNA (adenosine(37)-N6)-threonylcarbamoyltransferase complex ATPase subunit type 1 TsaE [Candidatus Colwellbacteria bacterium]
MTVIRTESLEQTRDLAAGFAEKISKNRKNKNRALVLLLSGDLGSGKTSFVQGALRYFGIKRVLSPTFVLMKHYRIPRAKNNIKDIYHVDAYRLKSFADLKTLGFDKVLESGKSLVFIEWPERLRTRVLKNSLKIKFSFGEKENERLIKLP